MKITYRLFFVLLLTVWQAWTLSAQEASSSPEEKKDDYFEVSKNIELFVDIYKELDRYYVDQLDHKKLIQIAIDKMLQSLDPYTNYIPENKVEDFKFQSTGKYGGIGAIISKTGKYIEVVEPYEGSPASKAGLRPGDIILRINDVDMVGKDVQDASELLRGQPGTPVTIFVKRVIGTHADSFDVTVTRAKIHVKNVPFYGMLDTAEGIGYIRLTNFRQGAAREVRSALEELKRKGAKKLILDLRGNPGGMLIEAVMLTNVFIPRNKLVVSTKGKVKDWDKTYHTFLDPVDTTMPLVVLINRGSASASEIVSGALQDYDRAVIMGTESFGKGLVQSVRPLLYNAQMKVTVARYLLPSGRWIQKIDYAHKDRKGRPVIFPDSSSKTFKTMAGREVKSGRGIHPDVEVHGDSLPLVARELLNQKLIFGYANLYRNTHDSVPPPPVFEMSNQEYADFVAFVDSADFSYETETKKILEKALEKSRKEGYYEEVKEPLNQLMSRVEANENAQLTKHKAIIKELLEQAIMSRYYYMKGRIQESFDRDRQLDSAQTVLKDPARYHRILQPPSHE